MIEEKLLRLNVRQKESIDAGRGGKKSRKDPFEKKSAISIT